MCRIAIHLLSIAGLILLSSCDNMNEPSIAPAPTANINGAIADGQVFINTQTTVSGDVVLAAELRSLVGLPFPGNQSQYFTVEGSLGLTDPATGEPVVGISYNCVTTLQRLAGGGDGSGDPITIESRSKDRFVAFIPKDFIDSISIKDVKVTRTCSTGLATVVVTGTLQDNVSSYPPTTATFPSMVNGFPVTGDPQSVFDKIDAVGFAPAVLTATAESAVYTNTGVPYTLIESELSNVPSKQSYECISSIVRDVGAEVGSPRIRTAIIEMSSNEHRFTPFIPSNLNRIVPNFASNKLVFTRACGVKATAGASVSGDLL